MINIAVPAWLAALSSAIAVSICSGCSYSCVADGTLIDTPDGGKPVETILVGDQVWTRAESGERAVGTIKAIRSTLADRTIEIRTTDDHLLCVTPEQPIWIDGQWSEASQLRQGRRLASIEGVTEVLAASISSEQRRVFDLTVEPNGTFYASGLLVHNKTMAPMLMPDRLAGAWIGIAPGGIWRMEFERDGTGRAVVGHGEWMTTYDIESTSLESFEYTISISLRASDDPIHTMRLMGRAYSGRLEVARDKRPAANERVIVFYREADLRRELDQLSNVMSTPEAADTPAR